LAVVTVIRCHTEVMAAALGVTAGRRASGARSSSVTSAWRRASTLRSGAERGGTRPATSACQDRQRRISLLAASGHPPNHGGSLTEQDCNAPTLPQARVIGRPVRHLALPLWGILGRSALASNGIVDPRQQESVLLFRQATDSDVRSMQHHTHGLWFADSPRQPNVS
jgi:hypothetical protein